MKTQVYPIALLFSLISSLPAVAQENILKIHVPYVEIKNATEIGTANSQTTLQYFDTAGRPVQSIRKGFTPEGGDLADYTKYDSLGCKIVEYTAQPFARDNQGHFLPEIFLTGSEGWKKTYRYEASVKHRPIASGGLHYGGKEVTYAYRLNTGSTPELSVLQLTLDGDNLACRQATDGIYHVTETCDEDGHRTLVFTDSYDRLMVSRRINGTEFYDTYYMYDILDRLICVLPPEATADFYAGGNYSLTSGSRPFLYCYRYEYDGNNHKTGIKCPGVDWEYIIYDGEDRPFMTQTGEQRARNEWNFNKYDGLGRIVLQGVVRETRPRQSIASQWATVAMQETFTGSGSCFGYSNEKVLGDGNYTFTTVLYYDTYAFTGLSWPHVSRPATSFSTHGLMTGRYEAVLNQPGQGRISVFSYDNKARLTEESSYTSLTRQSAVHKLSYNFSGLPIWEEYTYNDSICLTYTHEYDHGLRKISTRYDIRLVNGSPAGGGASALLSAHKYDAYGRLSEKRSFHDRTLTTYSYYPDGTLKEISNGAQFSQELYKGEYGTRPYSLSRSYNGNISDMLVNQQGQSSFWHYDYDGVDRLVSGVKYSVFNYQSRLGESEFYTYDRMGNIVQLMRDHRREHVNALYATYSGNQLVRVHDGGVYNTDYDYQTYPNLSDADQEYYYDANGNQTANLDKDIVAMRYNSLNLPDTVQLGNGNRIIHYYLSGGERIRTVSRTYTTPLSIPLDQVNNSNDPYTETTETHLGNLIYKDGSPDRLQCEGGYWSIQKNSASGSIDFHPFAYICDYLGSVRLVYDGITGSVVQSLEYLPSGLICNSTNYDLQPNKFTGKELLSMHGLNQYDSKARMQEFQLPGFTTPDPLSEKYYDWSPYGYCMGNPIRNIDPDGRKVRMYIETNGVGHAFITVGEGKNTVVYTYGRYLGGDKGKPSGNSTDPTGHGVMLKLTGKEALKYVNHEKKDLNAKSYIIGDANERKVKEYADKTFDSGRNLTETEASAYDKNPNKHGTSSDARIVDQYNILENNCTTKSIESVKEGGTSLDFKKEIIVSSPIYTRSVSVPIFIPADLTCIFHTLPKTLYHFQKAYLT